MRRPADKRAPRDRGASKMRYELLGPCLQDGPDAPPPTKSARLAHWRIAVSLFTPQNPRRTSHPRRVRMHAGKREFLWTVQHRWETRDPETGERRHRACADRV